MRIGRVQLQPPQGQAAAGSLPVVLVRALEPEAPPGETPIEWLLVSTEGEPTAAWAERIAGWYETRWRIEEFFRLLKSGTRIQDRRLRRAEALEKCLVLDAITAWRVSCLDRESGQPISRDIRTWVILLARMTRVRYTDSSRMHRKVGLEAGGASGSGGWAGVVR